LSRAGAEKGEGRHARRRRAGAPALVPSGGERWATSETGKDEKRRSPPSVLRTPRAGGIVRRPCESPGGGLLEVYGARGGGQGGNIPGQKMPHAEAQSRRGRREAEAGRRGQRRRAGLALGLLCSLLFLCALAALREALFPPSRKVGHTRFHQTPRNGIAYFGVARGSGGAAPSGERVATSAPRFFFQAITPPWRTSPPFCSCNSPPRASSSGWFSTSTSGLTPSFSMFTPPVV